ncbi:MAG: outer membrane protein assembly factor BamA [Candidatus Bathyarchaeia archaeon]
MEIKGFLKFRMSYGIEVIRTRNWPSRVALFSFFLFLLISTRGFCKETGVLIIPLKVYSKEDIENIRMEIEGIIETGLKEEGLRVVRADLVKDLIPLMDGRGLNDLIAREMGEKVHVDHVIWGGITKVGAKMSLDLRLSPVKRELPLIPIFAEGEGTEEILDRTGRLLEDIKARILERKKVLRVSVSGNRYIGQDAILIKLKVREGDYYRKGQIQEDIRAIYRMGYFEDVRVEVIDLPEGKEIVYVVKEKPTIREVLITGNRNVSKDDIESAISIKPKSVLNMDAINESIQKILRLYREKGYHAARVDYEVKELKENQVGLIIRIEEGRKFYIKEILFKGNEKIPSNELKSQMETKERGWLSWITGSGLYNKETLKHDGERLSAFYYNQGYINHRIGEPDVKIGEEWISIEISIQEGDQYRVGEVLFHGDLMDEDDLKKKVGIKEGEVFNREKLRKAVTALTEFYADRGYAHAEIAPDTQIDDAGKRVKVAFNIKRNQKVYFGRIRIFGNIKTRDKVIRRELEVNEGDMFSSSLLKKSNQNLKNLRYFEDVVFQTTKGETDDEIDLNVEVKEKNTGTFSIGAAYSSTDQLMGMAEISQSNLFGRGYMARLKADIGSRRQFFELTFIDPWLFDTRVGFRFDAYKTMKVYDDYTRESTGGRIGFVIPIAHYLYTDLSYMFEDVEVHDVAADAPEIFKQQEGKSKTSGIGAGIIWDSRDNRLYPSRGSYTRFDTFLAGPGGDNYFVKYILSSSWYFPLFLDTVLSCRGLIGYGHGWKGKELPVFERFFLGGLYSIRGFKYGEVGPRDPATGDVVGGDREILFNLEYIFPIEKKLELRGVIFYDRGNAYLGSFKPSDMRDSIGIGVRWFSPLGPLRLEWGYNLHPERDEKRYQWGFTVGGTF